MEEETWVPFDKNKYNLLKKELKGRIENNLSGFLRCCIVGLLVLVQIAVLIILPFFFQKYTVYFYTVVEFSSFFLILGLINDSRSPSFKIAWISISLMLPITGQVMYLLWGKADSKKKIESRVLAKLKHGASFLEEEQEIAKKFHSSPKLNIRMSKYLSLEGFPLFKNTAISYYSMGEDAFEAIFEDLIKAEKFILLNFFIVAEGALWDRMHEILLQKIKEGVRVYFMYDDFGATIRTHKNFRKEREAEGIQVRVFNPIHKYMDKLYMNYRSHQKIIVIDGNIGYTGGFNLADEYANLVERFGVWKDAGVRLEGDGVWGLTVIFFQMWEVCSGKELVDYNEFRPTKQFPENDVYLHVISDGPATKNWPIESIYHQMITYAGEYLYIMTPYLIIEQDMQDALITAAESGVDVRIITPNIPDKKNVKLLTNFNYGKLLEHGVRIYEYTPGFIHAKTIINDSCGIVGTVNMDYRSFYLHYENAVWIHHQKVVDEIKRDFMETLTVSREISYEEWKKRPLLTKMWQQVLNLFSTLM
jgi:cardiolipin synthase